MRKVRFPLCRHCGERFNDGGTTTSRLCGKCWKDGHRGNPRLGRCAKCAEKKDIRPEAASR